MSSACGPPSGQWEISVVLGMEPHLKEWCISVSVIISVIHGLLTFLLFFFFFQWPYTYDTCDVGTAPNQTINGLPIAATINGDHLYNDALSYLPGQRLSRCTCDGEDHPGPKHSDGSFVGRSAPEIDMFEAQMGGKPLSGEVSQSAQWAVSTGVYFG